MSRLFIMTMLIVLTSCTKADQCVSGVVTPAKAKAKAPVSKPTKPKDEIRVMVIDTGIDPHPALMKYLVYEKGEAYVDRHGHGTHVAGNHQDSNPDPICDNVKIYSCKYFDSVKNLNAIGAGIKCLDKAVELQIDYVNYSGGGTDYSVEEYNAWKRYVDSGGKAYVAAGNEKSDLRFKPYYPASYGLPYGTFAQLTEIIPVANIDGEDNLVPSSNFAPHLASEVGLNVYSTMPDSTYGFMTGTSQAAPAKLHTILKRKCELLISKK